MKVLVAGGYGFGNLGDEAILAGLIERLKRTNASVKILSMSPKQTFAMHRSEAIGYHSLHRIMHAIMTTDILLIGAGGIFDTRIVGRTRRTMACFYILCGYLALLTRRRIWFEGISVLTPDQITCSMLRLILRKAEKVSARDERSKKIMSDISGRAVGVVGDLTLSLKSRDKSIVGSYLDSIGISKPLLKVGLALRSTGKKDMNQKISVLVNELASWARQHSAHIILIAFSHSRWSNDEDDVAFLTDLRSKSDKKDVIKIFTEYVHPSILQTLIGEMDFLVGMRLQSLIMAHNTHVPMLALSYHPKVKLFCDMIGAETVSVNELDSTVIEGIVACVSKYTCKPSC